MSKSNTPHAVTVSILDKEYLVSCDDDDKTELMRSADYLDQKMREIRDGGKVIGSDRIAVMAALNISHELLTGESPEAGKKGNKIKLDDNVGVRLKGLQEKIEHALFKSQQMEL